MGVGQDVSGVEQLTVAQPADRAAPLVGREHPRPEDRLVQPEPVHPLHVASPVVVGQHGLGCEEALALVDGQRHPQLGRLVGDDEDGMQSAEDTGCHGDEPDQR
jgi:hypothetical protein